MFPQIQLTPTPVLEYTPPNPALINGIIGLAALIVIVILTGIWINKANL
ncbi:MAG: hypothetical protein RML93_07225 [Anaerolineales bacterium]|nr:hypothetical protein [Anaerolineales bacterium]MCS7247101.1 hypothetical protein [Anaerolineales bacterium]MDW8160912.1 hypothetical protein [Anaerolineales bacterium]MDW8447064.1 hypothetical protein [Anaerolineales bacterium]